MNKVERPLISFVLFAYNQNKYIEEAIKGVFSQTYSPLEVILSDDCSSDDTFNIMEKLANEYTGPHTIVLNRNENNLGLIRHVNHCSKMASSDIIIIGAGDDISLPARAECIYKAFLTNPQVLSVSHAYEHIDDAGNPLKNRNDFLDKGEYSLKDYEDNKFIPIYGATRAYKKSVFNNFPELSANCQAEDSALVFRSLLMGKITHIHNNCLKYRIHKESTARYFNFKSAKSIYKQNRNDFNYALNHELLNHCNEIKVKTRMLQRIKVGVLLGQLEKSKNPIFFFLLKFLFSNLMSPNEKKNYFFGVLKRILPVKIINILNQIR